MLEIRSSPTTDKHAPREFADLETSLTAANAEITELKALLDAATAPAAPLDPDKKKTTPASQWKSKEAKHKAAASAAVAAN